MCSLYFQASIPARYWVGLHTATYLLNRLPTKATSTTTSSPYFTLQGVAPSYEHLRVFDCACYPNLSTKATHKLTLRSARCVFLGYSADHKGYRCLYLITNNIVISRHVFDEADFPFSASPRLTNDLDNFLQVTPLVRLPCTHHCRRPAFPRVFHHWPQLAVRPAHPGGQTTPETKVGGPIASPSG
jgi:hypothetical protein